MGQYCDNIWQNENQQILHPNDDIPKVILHIELDESNFVTGKKVVTYEIDNHKIVYEYLSATETAIRIVNGEIIEKCYVEGVDFKEINYVLDLPEYSPLTLNKSIICRGCLIGYIFLVINRIEGLLDFSRCINPVKFDHNFLLNYELRELSATRTRVFGIVKIQNNLDSTRGLIEGDINLNSVDFHDTVEIVLLKNKGHITFEYSTICKDLLLNVITIGEFGSLDFNRAHLENATIKDSMITEDLIFAGAIIDDRITLLDLKVSNLVNFVNCRINNQLSINNCEFDKNIIITNTDNDKLLINKIYFENLIIKGELVMPFSFIKPDNNKHFLGRATILPKIMDSVIKKNQYNFIKEHYRKSSNSSDEDEAHWWASECDRLAIDEVKSRNKVTLIILYIVYVFYMLGLLNILDSYRYIRDMVFPIALFFFSLICISFPKFGKWIIYRKIFGYGVKPWNLIRTILIVIGCCAIFFAAADYRTTETNQILVYGENTIKPFNNSMSNGLYFSVITFATVGFGDVSATGWAAGLAMVEGLLGVILNAALIVVLFRKLVR